MKAIKTKIKTEEGYNSLYIPMPDFKEKRKTLLSSLKDSLIVQEEYEEIFELRKKKAEILRAIKKSMGNLNNDYQKIKKNLPNVKNVLSYTEKEINELDSHIDLLKGGIKADKERLSDYEDMREHESFREKPNRNEPQIQEHKRKKPIKKKSIEPLNKIDRIKNNLSVIESKLNKL